jgi:tetratricopeptide (TPR) repeat protein
MVNLDDDGNPLVSANYVRVFRNLPQIRYKNRIHESIVLRASEVLHVTDLSIVHTGYGESVYAETGKAKRNITMLWEELAINPNNGNLKMYLADSLLVENADAHGEEAERLFREALESGQETIPLLRRNAYSFLIPHARQKGNQTKAEEWVKQAIASFPDTPDFYYLYGNILRDLGREEAAWEQYRKSEELIRRATDFTEGWLIANVNFLFSRMLQSARDREDWPNAVRYATLTLKEDKYLLNILTALIVILRTQGAQASDSELFGVLSKLYNLDDLKDQLYLARAAKDAGDAALLRMVTEHGKAAAIL